MFKILKNHCVLDAKQINQEQLRALSNETRKNILKKLESNPSYPRQVSRELDISKQKAYYHFEKLIESDLIEKTKTENVSGGSAQFYKPSSAAYVVDIEGSGDGVSWKYSSSARKFLGPMTHSSKNRENYVVVGSPDQHGPDQVKARDGHLAGEVGMMLGQYGIRSTSTKLDTEVRNQGAFDKNMILIGGVLTNTLTKKFNQEFKAGFEGEEFPYRKIETPEEVYSQGEVGVIAKAVNPLDTDKRIFMAAGVQNRGTQAAVTAFRDLENILGDYNNGDFYRVVRGLDRSGDGKIDDYEVLE